MTKYWIAEGKAHDACEEIEVKRSRALSDAINLSRKYGGSRTNVITQTLYFGGSEIVGFKFSDEKKVDQKIFKRCKDLPCGWIPRLGHKEGREIAKQLRQSVYSLDKLLTAIGMKAIKGSRIRSPGIQLCGKKWVLSLPDDVKPKHCRRISDIEAESMGAK